MSGWDGAASIADLDPTPDELADLADVLAEVDGSGLDDDYDDDGSAQLAAISEAIELSNARRLAREREDGAPMPQRAEDRIAHLLGRVERGTYTELAQADDAAHGCGPLDEFGRCTSPYHSGYCFETARSEAATGNADAADAWRQQLLGNHQAAIELANARDELDAEVDQALAGPNDVDTYHAMQEILGHPVTTDPRDDPRFQQWLAEQADAGWAPEPDPGQEPEPAPPAAAHQQPEPEPDDSQDQASGQPMYYGFQHPDDAAAGVTAQGHLVHGQHGFGAGVSN